MKRSEMIKKLCEPIQLGNVDLHLWPEEAEAILKVLEDAGIQPPNITKSPNTWFRSTGDYGYEAAEWEPEDETGKQNKLKPTPLTDEELADVIANDEDLQNET